MPKLSRYAVPALAVLLVAAAAPAHAAAPHPDKAEANEEVENGSEAADNEAGPRPLASMLSRADAAAVAREELDGSGLSDTVDWLKTWVLVLSIAVALLTLLVIALLVTMLRLRSALAAPKPKKGGPLSAAEEDLYGSKAIPD